MTLEQKAEEYIEKNCKIWEEGELTVDEIVRLAGAKYETKRLEKENKQLKAQIEKMKNWCNCGNYQVCLFQRAEEGKGLKAEECHTCNDWQLKE